MINEENNAEDVLSFKSHTSKKKKKKVFPLRTEMTRVLILLYIFSWKSLFPCPKDY